VRERERGRERERERERETERERERERENAAQAVGPSNDPKFPDQARALGWQVCRP
jgi:hypothetical protein